MSFSDFNRVFNQTPEQKGELETFLEKAKKLSYDKQRCCTCANYIPVDDDLTNFIIAYPRCKKGGLVVLTCLFYERNKEDQL